MPSKMMSMAFPVQKLLNQKQKPVSVSPVEAADAAFRLMREHGFSQLPVISDKGIVLGLVNHESILRALSHFNVPLDKLRVSGALIQPRTFFPDDDLFDLLDALDDDYATLIVDKEDRLLGIVTQEDLLAYFRKRSEDMLIVEEIEMGLRDHVLCAFSDSNGGLAREDLCTAVDEVADLSSRYRKKFIKALGVYLGATNGGSVNSEEAEKSFRAFELKYHAKEMKDLSFDETRALFLHEKRWNSYKDVFGIDKKSLSDLLAQVRDARNKLAHFRGDLSDTEREKILFCAQFLDNHRPTVKVPLIASIREAPESAPATKTPVASSNPQEPAKQATDLSIQTAGLPHGFSSIEDEMDFEGSRYAPLVFRLSNVQEDSITLGFEEIEATLSRRLPPTARRHRAWWANDRVSHTQSRLWLEAGWRVSSINITGESVTFSRIKGREEAYIDFFGHILRELGIVGSPNGGHWHVLERISNGTLSALAVCGFAKGGRFRIELYIDLGVKDNTQRKLANKKLFDRLAEQRDEIEGKLGHRLSWERLDLRTPSRIALYSEGSILDSKEELARLVKWTTQMAPRFINAIKLPVQEALSTNRPT